MVEIRCTVNWRVQTWGYWQNWYASQLRIKIKMQPWNFTAFIAAISFKVIGLLSWSSRQCTVLHQKQGAQITTGVLNHQAMVTDLAWNGIRYQLISFTWYQSYGELRELKILRSILIGPCSYLNIIVPTWTCAAKGRKLLWFRILDSSPSKSWDLVAQQWASMKNSEHSPTWWTKIINLENVRMHNFLHWQWD